MLFENMLIIFLEANTLLATEIELLIFKFVSAQERKIQNDSR